MRRLGQKVLLGLFTVGFVLSLASSKMSGQSYTDLHDFNCTNEGCNPTYPALLAQGRDGNIYGTTDSGGIYGDGTVFKLSPSGTITTLYNFDGTTGSVPQGGLVLGPDGNFYGTTEFSTNAAGTIFKITPTGTVTTLHTFAGGTTDGAWPLTPPVLGNDGMFYGVTGVNQGPWTGVGYRISSAGNYQILATSLPGGAFWAPLMQASNGWGYAPLVQDAKGYLCGTEAQGGTLGGGVVFKITTSGKLTVLHNFLHQDSNDGWLPAAGLVLATDGNLYRSTFRGNPTNNGALFKITRSGPYTQVHVFDGTDGTQTEATAMQHTNGKIYGLTSLGGVYDGDVLYSLNVGVKPFVSLVFNAGKVGRSIGILGQGFKGTTTVSSNGTPATFNVVSSTYLVAKVPTGATTGPLSVKPKIDFA